MWTAYLVIIFELGLVALSHENKSDRVLFIQIIFIYLGIFIPPYLQTTTKLVYIVIDKTQN